MGRLKTPPLLSVTLSGVARGALPFGGLSFTTQQYGAGELLPVTHKVWQPSVVCCVVGCRQVLLSFVRGGSLGSRHFHVPSRKVDLRYLLRGHLRLSDVTFSNLPGG